MAWARFDFAEQHMGTRFRIRMYVEALPGEVRTSAADVRVMARAETAAKAAFARVAELNAILSDYDANSELSKLSRSGGSGQSIKLSEELYLVLKRSQAISQASGGKFDITIGPYKRLWRRARRQRELPAQRHLDDAAKSVGYEKIKLDHDKRTATLTAPGMKLDLGGIAKGYAADEALAVLKKHGITRALVDAGGDVVVGDAPPRPSKVLIQRPDGFFTPNPSPQDPAPGEPWGWRIGVVSLQPRKVDGQYKPSKYLMICNAAVATSGDAFQFIEIDGKRYSHLLDPSTGLGLTDRSRVTVVARDGITADSLASAVSVMGPKPGLKLIEATPGAAAHVLRAPTGDVTMPEVHQSQQWRALRFVAEEAGK